MAFSSYKTVAIKASKIPNTDQSNFPFVFVGSFPFLSTCSNVNGYDIVFATDSAGTNRLAHELIYFNRVNGAMVAWVKIPTVSHTADTTFYVCWGDPTINTSQENKAAVWSNSYGLVMHLNGTSFKDSTGVVADSTTTGSVSSATYINSYSGKPYGSTSIDNNASTSYVRVPSNAAYKPTNAITLECWAYLSRYNTNWDKFISLDYYGTGSWTTPYVAYCLSLYNTTHQLCFNFATSGSAIAQPYTSATVPLGQWVHLAASYDTSRGTVLFYINGAQDATVPSYSTPLQYGTSKDLCIGNRSPYTASSPEGLEGYIEEVRISTAARTGDWIAAQYAMMNDPASFFTVDGVAPNPLKMNYQSVYSSILGTPSQPIVSKAVYYTQSADWPHITGNSTSQQAPWLYPSLSTPWAKALGNYVLGSYVTNYAPITRDQKVLGPGLQNYAIRYPFQPKSTGSGGGSTSTVTSGTGVGQRFPVGVWGNGTIQTGGGSGGSGDEFLINGT